MKITGLNSLGKKFEEVEKAAAALDGYQFRAEFDPHDPQSIETAINVAEGEIDSLVSNFKKNEIVLQMVESFKEQARSAILEKASAARLNSGEDSVD